MVFQIPKTSLKHQINGHEIYHRSNKVKGPWRKKFRIFKDLTLENFFRIFKDLKVFLNN
jgi:hypothetical protein